MHVVALVTGLIVSEFDIMNPIFLTFTPVAYADFRRLSLKCPPSGFYAYR